MIKTVDSISPISIQESISKSQDSSGIDFFSVLQNSINDLNEKQVQADKALSDIATARVKDLHSAAITIGKAELSMQMMLEIRNKALNAYKEILKTPI